MFKAPAEHLDTPSRRRALEALPSGGCVLDVGAGGGAAGLALVPPLTRLTAVDETAAMLAMLCDTANGLGVDVTTVEGRWPDVAAQVAPADVVVCHHVLYNAAELSGFVSALDAHARRRVVVEITEHHPMAGLNTLWRHFHGADRPEGPGAADALAVLAEAGIDAHTEHFARPARWQSQDRSLQVAFARRRLCLPVEADEEVDALLAPEADLLSTGVVCIWWDT